MLRASLIAIAWLVVTAAATGAAQSSASNPRPSLPLALDWTAPPECPAATELRAELERIARVRPGFTLRPLIVRARVIHRGTLYRTALATEHEGRRGERLLEAPDCKTLARSVTLVLALAFGAAVEVDSDPPSVRAESPAPTASTPPATDAPPSAATSGSESAELPTSTRDAPPSAASPREATDEPPGPPFELAWALGAGGTLNLLPRAAWMLTTGPELRIGALSLALRLLALPDVTRERPDLSLHGHALGGALQACGNQPLAASLELALCGGARIVSVSARASGAEIEPDSAHAAWTALTAAASITWPRTFWLRVRLELALALSLGRPHFVIDGTATDHRVPQWVPDLGIAGLATF